METKLRMHRSRSDTFSYHPGPDVPDEQGSTGTENRPSGHRKNFAVRRHGSPLDTPARVQADLPARKDSSMTPPCARLGEVARTTRNTIRLHEKRCGEKRPAHANRICMIDQRAPRRVLRKQRRPRQAAGSGTTRWLMLSGRRSRPVPRRRSHRAVRRVPHDRSGAPGRSSLRRRRPR